MNPPPEAFSDYDLDVLIIGAGFSGIYQLYKCRLLNLRAKIFEAGSDLGGVWYWNCYPGARVDVPVPSYEFTLREIWEDWWWTERYPGQEEIRAYFAHVEKKLDIKKDVCFDTRVTEACFDESHNRWTVHAEDGITARSKFLVTCLGFGSKPYIPDIPNLSLFRGSCGVHHTARWPREGVDIKGKRVGVIGTGASGVQIVQTLSKTAQKMTVFQRTPNLAMPMRQTRLDRETQDKEKHLYPYCTEESGKPPVITFIIDSPKTNETFLVGIHYDFHPKKFYDASPEERLLLLEGLWKRVDFPTYLKTSTTS
ncbi:hypothetical protein D9757_013936 [Collybiopsis confluens]|uniref:Cyclopentanone 1,2-monooxygenase n=1 Tax=Collybiopsis confluens TaxID=2823264 RepID=A0A8H5GIS0_9AGAR|nr:hypothetical protein D9757_013936 [Collybiopsis confluens]